MSITRARVPMIVGALMAVSLVAAGCGTGDSKSDGDPNGVKDVLHSKGREARGGQAGRCKPTSSVAPPPSRSTDASR